MGVYEAVCPYAIALVVETRGLYIWALLNYKELYFKKQKQNKPKISACFYHLGRRISMFSALLTGIACSYF